MEDPIMMSAVEWQLMEYVRQNQYTIVNAMQVYANKMDESAELAQKAHDAGQSDGLVTNNGYKHAAEMARESAAKARNVASTITEKIDAVDEQDS